MKTSTIKSVTFDKSFSTQHGTLYAHRIYFDNGEDGNINCKSELPDWLQPGKEMRYESSPNGKFPWKIKRVNPDYNGNSTPEIPINLPPVEYSNGELIRRIEKLEKRVDELESGKIDKAVDRPVSKQDATEEFTDDLPF